MSQPPFVPTPEQVLAAVPQRPPFRFVDEALEIGEDRVVTRYTFTGDEWFFRGHFPGHPVTPGVILTEIMAQGGVSALIVVRLAQSMPYEDILEHVGVLTDCRVEFHAMVRPSDRVTVTARPDFFRRMRMRARVEVHTDGGELVADGVIGCVVIKQDALAC